MFRLRNYQDFFNEQQNLKDLTLWAFYFRKVLLVSLEIEILLKYIYTFTHLIKFIAEFLKKKLITFDLSFKKVKKTVTFLSRYLAQKLLAH